MISTHTHKRTKISNYLYKRTRRSCHIFTRRGYAYKPTSNIQMLWHVCACKSISPYCQVSLCMYECAWVWEWFTLTKGMHIGLWLYALFACSYCFNLWWLLAGYLARCYLWMPVWFLLLFGCISYLCFILLMLSYKQIIYFACTTIAVTIEMHFHVLSLQLIFVMCRGRVYRNHVQK